MKTYSTTPKDIKRKWHLVDADNKILGRFASKIAQILIGKNKVYFTPHLDCGDYVIVLNTDKIKVTGRKKQQKIYYHHSGFPGGLKSIPFERQLEKDSRKIIYLAVKNMLPKNKLRQKRLKRLRLYKLTAHPYQDKIKK